MSTRSRIGIVREMPPVKPFGTDRTKTKGKVIVESIYCHFDGYPEGVGQTLLDHWTDEKKINRLVALGDLSSLGSVIGRKHDFDTHQGPSSWKWEGTDEEYAAARAESPYGKGWCLFYGRDRGEKDVGSVVHEIDHFPDYGQEAEYLFDPATQEWRVRRQANNPVGWNTVTPWEGWISIPEAIELEQQAQAEYEASRA